MRPLITISLLCLSVAMFGASPLNDPSGNVAFGRFTKKKLYDPEKIVGEDTFAYDPSDTSEMVQSTEEDLPYVGPNENPAEEVAENDEEEDEDARMIGGSLPPRRLFSFVVSIQDYTGDFGHPDHPVPGMLICAGTIISPSWIITAAHVWGSWNDPSKNDIRANADNEILHKNIKNSILRQVHKVYPHPSFKFPKKAMDATSLPHDIALLFLKKPFEMNDGVKAILFAPENYIPPVGSVGVMAGWGAKGYKDMGLIYPGKLLGARMTVSSLDVCKKAFPKMNDFDNTKICSNTSDDNARACVGDDGGPYLQIMKETDVLVGIITGGSAECNMKKPTYFTRVTAYIPWIQKQMQQKQPTGKKIKFI